MSVDIHQVRELLDKSLHMSLGTSQNDKPWVCEVHFSYDDDLAIYFMSYPNTRHCQDIVANPSVAGNIVKQHDITEMPNGLYYEGTAEELESLSDEELVHYCERLGRDIDEHKAHLERADGKRMYKITITNWAVFGAYDGNKPQKYEIAWNGGKK